MKKRVIIGFVLTSAFLIGCGYMKQKAVPLEEKRATPLNTPIYKYDKWVIARASMHNHTIYSDGCRTPEDLVEQARNEGIAILSINDHREGQMCVSKRVCINAGGVDSKKAGYKKHYEHIMRLANSSEMPIIIYGLEVVPYLWNERNFPWLLGRGGNFHFTTYGIYDTKIYEEMPARKEISLKKEKDPGIEPFIKFVDYIVDNGGIVFLAHPDVADNQWLATIHHWSPAPVHLPIVLKRLSGFAVIPEGSNEVGKPGGPWDQALLQYIAGVRDEPLWAWGEADFHCYPPTDLRLGTTLFYLMDFKREEVFKAIKSGKMVALMGELFQDVYVSEFSASEAQKVGEKIMFGQEIKVSSPVIVKFSLNREVPLKEARLIRNGKIIFTTKSSSFEFKDEEFFRKKLNSFYRVELIGEDSKSKLYTNPIFVGFE